MNIYQAEESSKKASSPVKFRNCVRTDLNKLIAQNTKLIEQNENVLKKVDSLTKEVIKLKSSSEVIR